jgi:hypothetical protein
MSLGMTIFLVTGVIAAAGLAFLTYLEYTNRGPRT